METLCTRRFDDVTAHRLDCLLQLWHGIGPHVTAAPSSELHVIRDRLAGLTAVLPRQSYFQSGSASHGCVSILWLGRPSCRHDVGPRL